MIASQLSSLICLAQLTGKENAESASSNESELAFLTRQIALYESKYNGEFERTLGSKNELTPEEETDAEIWKHLLAGGNDPKF